MEQQVKERIYKVLEAKRYSLLQFCRLVEKPVATYHRQLHDDNAVISSTFIFDILKNFPDVSADWLLCGRGEMFYSQSNGVVVANGSGNNVTNSNIGNCTPDLMPIVRDLQEQNKKLLNIIDNLTKK